MSTFEIEFAEELNDTLTYDTATPDATGKLVPDGNPVSVDCYIEGEDETITTEGGKEIVSTLKVFVGVLNLTTDGHVYTVPARFQKRENIECLAIDRVSDNVGPYYEMLMF